MKDKRHIKRFNEASENLNISDVSESKNLVVRVKHLIQYLTENFDPEATVHLDKDGWMVEYSDAVDEIDLIKKQGPFEKYKDNLWINN